MNSQPIPHTDRKLLFVVAGCVAAGALAVAIVAGLNARDERAATAREMKPVPVAGEATAGPGGVPVESPAPDEGRTESAGEPVVAAGPGVVIDPHADPWGEGVRAYAERDYDIAAAYLAADAERRPDHAYTHYMLGLALWKSSRLDDALQAMERSAALYDRSIRTFVNLARIRLARGDTEAALESAERALALDPLSASALYQKARALYAMDRADEAVRVLDTCVEVDPAAGQAHNLLGLIRLRGGDTVAALGSLEVAAALLPEVAYAQNNYGLALERAGRFAEAAVAFRRATEAESGHDAARVSLARVEAHVPGAVGVPIEVRVASVETAAVVPEAEGSEPQETGSDPASD